MLLLSLDTTTRAASCAVARDGVVLNEEPIDPTRQLALQLPGALRDILDLSAIALEEVDAFAVATGPGSFTGLRIGIATIQGLALATGKPVVAVSALEALAQSAGRAPGTLIAAWMDARRREVFAALYRVVDAPPFSPERLVEVEGPTAGDPAATLARWGSHLRGASVTFVGDGAALYAEAIADHRPMPWDVVPEPPLLAGVIGRMAVVRAQRGDTIDPAAVHPLYVRRPDVEVERERKTLP